MNKIFSLFIVLSLFASCKKSGSGTAELYMNFNAGSTWNYQQVNTAPTPSTTNYTVTSTNRDTTIVGKKYHVFTNSGGGNQYYNNTGNDYFQFDSIKLATVAQSIDRLYLKDNAALNSTWAQSISFNLSGVPVPIPLTITNTITETGISKTVNNIVYANVIHVQTTLTSTLIPAASLTSTINTYYARKYGLIENSTVIALNFSGFMNNVNTTTKLMSSNLL